MFVRNLFRLDLKHLILLLAFSTAALTLVNGLFASYQVQRQLLIEQALSSNHAYASKLADVTTHFLLNAQQTLAYNARMLSSNLDSPEARHEVTERLMRQSGSFSSVAIIDPSGKILNISPDTLPVLGKQLTDSSTAQALDEQRPMISDPFISPAGNLLVLISHPIFSPTGKYLGYLAGSLYLKERNILSNILGKHFYEDGSYIYVADKKKRLIYHPKRERVGEQVLVNPVIDAVVAGEQGMSRVINSKGVDMLAGYAPIPAAGWGVVAQRPVKATLATLNQQMWRVASNTLPVVLVTLILILWLSRLIANPLRKLAESAQSLDHEDTLKRINSVRSWYFESDSLKQAMLTGVNLVHRQLGRLQDAAARDPLTGLGNRRSLDSAIALHHSRNTPFSVLAVDVDHFKAINDTYGHDVGDQVLKGLAERMSNCFRKDDLICRAGGEEFIIILPGSSLDTAWVLAERLRKEVESSAIAPLEQLHISIGLAEWPLQADDPYEVLKYADKALYRAKQNGRNRCELHQSE